VPISKIIWYKDEQIIQANDKFDCSANGASLIVRNVNLNDSGNYTCKVKGPNNNEVDEQCHYVQKKVLHDYMLEYEKHSKSVKSSGQQVERKEKQRMSASLYKNKPSFDTYLKNCTAEEGMSAKLFCCIKGENPTVEWYKNGKTVHDDFRHIITVNDGIISLEIFDVSGDDVGDYECKVENPLGTISSKCSLTMYENQHRKQDISLFTRPIKGIFERVDMHKALKPNFCFAA
jgi:hypothetical protein